MLRATAAYLQKGTQLPSTGRM
jgi:hypothetical protein